MQKFFIESVFFVFTMLSLSPARYLYCVGMSNTLRQKATKALTVDDLQLTRHMGYAVNKARKNEHTQDTIP